MKRKVRNIISFSLVLIFMLPMTGKMLDGIFHHHDHFHCKAKSEKHIHKHHEECPIASFELALFSSDKQVVTIREHYFCVEIKDLYSFNCSDKNSKKSHLLRAPPFFTV